MIRKLIATAVLSLAVAGPAFAAKDIVDTAAAAGQFKTLIKAAQAAGLVETLKGPGPLTVFAPDDAAFAKLPAGSLDALLKDKDKLAKVLKFHVVSGKVMAKDVTSGNVPTVQGQSLKVVAGSGGVMVNNAKVVKTDIEASNGVIHVIDQVVMPE
jgi:uncharacterized surface protein with fasciclin (FAS1) repeats